LVQRSILVLEEYLRLTAGVSKRNGKDVHAVEAESGNGRSLDRASAPMSRAEALEILGLGPDAAEQQIDDAHRRLVQLIHPDRGGSHYFTVKVNQAKDALVGASAAPTASAAEPRQRKPGRRPQRQQEP
jgi:hypothetical protein